MKYTALLYSLAEFGENSKSSLLDSLLGMGVVFAVLAILWGSIELFHVCFKAATSRKKKEQTVPEPAKPVGPENEIPVETEPEEDELEIIAAISAALSEYLNVPQSAFRVVSFKRASNDIHWNRK